MSDVVRGVPPGPVRAARVILYIQGVLTLLVTLFVLMVVVARAQHGQRVPGFGYAVLVEGLVVGVLVLVCAVLIGSGRSWVRPLVMVLEVLAIVAGVVNLLSGAFQAVIGIGLAITVMILMWRPEVTAWLRSR